MQKSHPEDVVAIAINVDHEAADAAPSDELRQEVLATLTELNLEVTNVIASDAYDSMLERYDLFSLPAVIVYGRNGEKLEVFEGDLNYETQVVPLIERQLAPSTDAPEAANPASAEDE